MTDRRGRGGTGGDGPLSSEPVPGWPGTTLLPPVTLFGCRFRPVVELDRDVHLQRSSHGIAPQLDEDVLTIWEWPESDGPAPALTLRGALFEIGRSWRRTLRDACRWQGFGPVALLDRAGTPAPPTRPVGGNAPSPGSGWCPAEPGRGRPSCPLTNGPRTSPGAAPTAGWRSSSTSRHCRLVHSPPTRVEAEAVPGFGAGIGARAGRGDVLALSSGALVNLVEPQDATGPPPEERTQATPRGRGRRSVWQHSRTTPAQAGTTATTDEAAGSPPRVRELVLDPTRRPHFEVHRHKGHPRVGGDMTQASTGITRQQGDEQQPGEAATGVHRTRSAAD